MAAESAKTATKSSTQKLNDLGSDLKDFGQAVLSVLAGGGLIGAGVLGVIAVLLLVVALVFRLPLIAPFGRWMSRRRWGTPGLYDGQLARVGEMLRGFVVRIFGWVAGCDLRVSNFASAASVSSGSSGSGADSGSIGDSGSGVDARSGADVVAASLRAALGVGDSASPGDVTLVSTTISSTGLLRDVADALKDVPQLKVIGPLLTLSRTILPRDQFTIEGEVLGEVARGYALVLSLTARQGNVMATQTFWSHDYDPLLPADITKANAVDEFQRLGMAAAAWTVFRVAEARGQGDRLKALGCSSWRSYALFRAGVDCQHSGEVGKAIALYSRALDADPSNNAARLNLGVLEVLGGNTDIAVSRLEDVERDTRKPEQLDRILYRDSLWYQAAYNLTAARLSDNNSSGGAAYEMALDLAIAIETALNQLVKHNKPAQSARLLREFLRQIRAPAFALLADAAAVYAGPPE